MVVEVNGDGGERVGGRGSLPYVDILRRFSRTKSFALFLGCLRTSFCSVNARSLRCRLLVHG